jgi:hypothetical protein
MTVPSFRMANAPVKPRWTLRAFVTPGTRTGTLLGGTSLVLVPSVKKFDEPQHHTLPSSSDAHADPDTADTDVADEMFNTSTGVLLR